MTDLAILGTASPASTMMLIRTMATLAGSLTASACIGADAGSVAEVLKGFKTLPLSMRREASDAWTGSRSTSFYLLSTSRVTAPITGRKSVIQRFVKS
jgi:hypothetical protein